MLIQAGQDKIARASTSLFDRQDYRNVKLMTNGGGVRAKLHTQHLFLFLFFSYKSVINENYGAEGKDGSGNEVNPIFPFTEMIKV